MSRLRRMVVSDRFFFVTCRVHRLRGNLSEGEFAVLASVARERREAHRFLLTAWALVQGRFSDRALRTVKEYHETVAYIHGNPVKAKLVLRPEDWPWSSVHDYTGSVNKPRGQGSPIPVDRITMPADEETRI
jgi:REP element-mobilizing transposase RayT